MEFPAWEYALDEEGVTGQNERTVKPYVAAPPLDLNDAYFIVRATFVFADGSRHQGYMKPKLVDSVGQDTFMPVIIPYDLSPILIVNHDVHIHFQYGPEKPGAEEIQQIYTLLAKEPDQVFPIRFSSDVEVLDSLQEGTLDGFMYFDQPLDDFRHVISLKLSDIKYVK